MRNFVLAASLVIGACTFEHGSLPGEDDPTDLGTPTGTGTGSGSDSGTPQPARTCSWDDSTLRLCLEFEDQVFDPRVTDASPARLDAPTDDVGPTRGADGNTAAGFAWASRIDVPESTMLDITGPMTIEMWVWPAYSHSANLLVNAGQYQVQLAGDRRIGCALGNSQVWSIDNVDSDEWTHIACVYDGSSLSVYLDGDFEGTGIGAAAPSGGTSGTRIGSGFVGAIDDIRIYAKAVGPSDVCRRATGQTVCASTGGSGGPDDGN